MRMRSEVTRRGFLKNGLESTAGIAVFSNIAFIARPERVFGANDRIRVGVCGLHGRGMDHVSGFRGLKNTEVAAVCDVDEEVLAQRLPEIEKMGIPKPQTFIDIRKLLDDKSVDVIAIATPNHWHALMGIWACQAGKDVYIEKPCCHSLWEGKQLVKAAKKYDRIVQHGAQIRSAPALRDAVRRMREGLLGEVYMARGLCFKWRNTIGRAPEQPVPKGVHYYL